ncbi:MAG: aminoacetone oxidase family FAD-binding enzyme [Clostridia bacterium]|nr:aminoacetone oxidase family FAD-binding enzyme [Clostridia bacterium]
MKNGFEIAVIGGGASGLTCAVKLAKNKQLKVLVLERGERLGRKLSATGNGQGNLTNERVGHGGYFSVSSHGEKRAEEIVEKYSKADFLSFLESLGALCEADEKGRVYPTSRQASSITDLFRYRLERAENVFVCTKALVESVERKNEEFVLRCLVEGETKTFYAKNVVLCTGGTAAKNFGTDGNGYKIAKAFGHTLTPLYPSLVQLKTEKEKIKTLKGIRVNDACVVAFSCGKEISREIGDVIFTDYGVSGDAIFRTSAFVADKIDQGTILEIDFLPNVSKERLISVIAKKLESGANPKEVLCGIVNNQLGRVILSCAACATPEAIACEVKSFTLPVLGSLGFDYAQVTKGGVPLCETDENLQSKKQKGLYFAGEILDADGECGGFNLQFAYSSASVVAEALLQQGAKKQ